MTPWPYPLTKLSEANEVNPKFLSDDEKRIRDGYYPACRYDAWPPHMPKLRLQRELSAADHERAAELINAGASVTDVVRDLNVTRATSWALHKRYRPAEPLAPSEPRELEYAPEQAPAPEPAPPAFDWDAYRKGRR